MLKLKIVSPEKVEFSGEVQSVTVPGTMGIFEILDNHAPILSSLMVGDVVYQTTDGATQKLKIAGGFVSVQKNVVELCVEKNIE